VEAVISTNAIMPDIQEEQLADEVAPESVPQSDDPPTFGVNNRDLPDILKDAFDRLINKYQARDVYDRRIEVLMDRILRFYDDGVQHVYPNWGTGVYQVGTAGGYVNIGNGKSIECPEFMGAYNIFRIRRRSLDAVLTQNEPPVDFTPDRPGQSEDIEAAETAEGYRALFDQNNDIKKIQQDIARMFELSGRAVAWTKTLKSRAKFGENADGSARSMETANIYGTLESKVPIVCDSFYDALYCFLYDDLDALTAKAENDWIADEIAPGEAGIGESDWERYARIGARQAKKSYYLTGMALSYLTTEMNCFLRPDGFTDKSMDEPYTGEMPDGSMSDGTKTIQEMMEMLYPDGAHVKYIGKTYSESWNECPDDALDVGFPVERDGLSGGALMEPDKVVQDAFNDYMNAKRQNLERGWSFTMFRGDAEDYDAIVDQHSQPRGMVLLKMADPGQPIEDSFYTEPQAEAPAGFDEAIQELKALSQELVGALPALEGNAAPSQTASGQAMDRSQAMGMLGPAWANMIRMFAGIYTKAALLASKNPDHGSEIAVTAGDGSTISIKLERLTKGKFHAHMSESSFPETTASKRANLQQIIQMAAQSPVGQALFESPDNWFEMFQLNGNPDLVFIPAIAFKKQTRELETLLQQPPVDNQAAIDAYNVQHAEQALTARAAGLPDPPYQAPPKLLPSLMPEADDYHQWESAKCQEYLSSEDCWTRQNVGTPESIEQAKQGVQNVRLHKGVHDQFMQQQAAAKAQAMQQLKPPSESINFKDEPPPAQAAMNKQAGINVAPEATPQVNKKAAAPGTPGTGTV
jgi:hypothetical protein